MYKLLHNDIINKCTLLNFNGTRKFIVGWFSVTRRYASCKDTMEDPTGIFSGADDRFNGISVDSITEYNDKSDFANKLQKSLAFWVRNKKRCIWFKVHKQHSAWIPQLSKNGFDFHHAQKGFVVMNKWLPTNEVANIPKYANTIIGVGGLVINEDNEVLVVRDKNALIPNSWKLPGGYVEPKENLIDAAIREVREETGLECSFKTIVSFRHSHGGGFGCSDLYVVIGLCPLSSELKRCQREISEVKWMPVSEYLNHSNVHETNRHFVRTFFEYKNQGIQFDCQLGLHQILKKEYCIYFVKSIEKQNQS